MLPLTSDANWDLSYVRGRQANQENEYFYLSLTELAYHR